MRNTRGVIAAAGIFTVLVAGCSSTDDDTTPDEGSTSPSAEASATPSSSDSTTKAAAETITFDTNYGPIGIKTDPAAPETVAGQIKLAKNGYFDNTVCHRVVTSGIFVLQCGDPTGTGTGGPGYELPDENLPEATENNYPAGTVAMANAGPGTAGSQFFLVYEDTTLPPGYTIWGTITDGLQQIKKIGKENAAADVTDGNPINEVKITSVKVQ